MSAYKVGMVVGSLRQASINRRLAQALAALFPTDFEIEFIDIAALPFYNQDLDGKQPAEVEDFKAHIAAQDAMVFVSPEYNRSIPGVLKNALDQGSRPYGRSVWSGKPAGVIGTSSGAIGTALMQQHLRNVLVFLDMPTLNQPEAFVQWHDDRVNEEGQFDASSREFMQKWVDSYVAWVRRLLA